MSYKIFIPAGTWVRVSNGSGWLDELKQTEVDCCYSTATDKVSFGFGTVCITLPKACNNGIRMIGFDPDRKGVKIIES